jgi:hypothetical protein
MTTKWGTNVKNAAHETNKNEMTQFKSQGLNSIAIHNISLMMKNGLVPKKSYR